MKGCIPLLMFSFLLAEPVELPTSVPQHKLMVLSEAGLIVPAPVHFPVEINEFGIFACLTLFVPLY
jgi:hypothetical protein